MAKIDFFAILNTLGEEAGDYFSQDPCQLPIDEGNCRMIAVDPFYGFENGQCIQFYWCGRHGNANRFNSLAECQQRCLYK